jgi:4-hydroxythreonine-4-phosphate dehydrogenase
MRWAFQLVGATTKVVAVESVAERQPSSDVAPVKAGSTTNIERIRLGEISAEGGQAACDFLTKAVETVQKGEADAIVTAPLHKEGLRAAGIPYPGHTEILAGLTGTRRYAMALYGNGIAVIHVTLHVALRDIFNRLTEDAVLEKIVLLDDWVASFEGRRPRLGVAGLNPHASDGGMFGDEEARIIEPAVRTARAKGIQADGPIPSDSLFVLARKGLYDGVIVMYHDQGHIAMKLLGIDHLVNITIGLPIIRTSVAHGTAYDIAGKGVADAASLVEAVRVASQLASRRMKDS